MSSSVQFSRICWAKHETTQEMMLDLVSDSLSQLEVEESFLKVSKVGP